jgi:hypothetical protein
VYGFLGQKSRSFFWTVQKESLQKKKAEISLCIFSEDEYAVKEFL